MALDKRSVRTEEVNDVQVELSRDGSLVGPTNPVPVTVVEGSGFSPIAEHDESAALAAQSSETIQFTLIPAATNAYLQALTVSAEVPFTAVLRKDDGVSPVEVVKLQGEAGATIHWTPRNPLAGLHTLAGDGAATRFDVVVTNNNVAAVGSSGTVAVNVEWDEA